MKARIKGLTLSLDGGQELTLSLPGDWRDEYAKLKDADVDVEVKKYREKRSLDSSASALYDALKVYLYSKTESTL